MDNRNMATTEPNSLISPQIMAEIQAAADRAAKGLLDPERLAKSCERMDQLREEIRQKHGILDIGAPAIRELRDGE